MIENINIISELRKMLTYHSEKLGRHDGLIFNLLEEIDELKRTATGAQPASTLPTQGSVIDMYINGKRVTFNPAITFHAGDVVEIKTIPACGVHADADSVDRV